MFDGDLAHQDEYAKDIAGRHGEVKRLIDGIAAIHTDDTALVDEMRASQKAYDDAIREALRRSRADVRADEGARGLALALHEHGPPRSARSTPSSCARQPQFGRRRRGNPRAAESLAARPPATSS